MNLILELLQRFHGIASLGNSDVFNCLNQGHPIIDIRNIRC